ncbi:MAG: prenyltransferase/squalene oxidase repeat-containing protein [Thermoguttaceae bacterium]
MRASTHPTHTRAAAPRRPAERIPTRRRRVRPFGAAGALVLLLCRWPAHGWSQEAPKTDAKPAISTSDPFAKDQTDAAVEKAIAYLVSQQRTDGAITDKGHETTMSSLAIMAMASVGVQPADPDPRGRSMGKALEYVLHDDRQNDKGYYGHRDGSRMYGHGITTLMLSEMLGMGTGLEQDREIHQRCQRAIDLILSSQKVKKPLQYRGGWRYGPDDSDADLSVTIWQLMALRSAKNDGLEVPAEAIHDAVEYLKRSYASTLDPNGMPDKRASGFCYTPSGRSPTYTMTAAGLLAMQVCGEYDSPLVAGAADWLLEHPPKWKEHFFFYGTYYYAQGMYQRGGNHAETAQRLVQEVLLEKQQPDGSWQAEGGQEGGVGKVYATSLAVLSLSVKYHYLPIYQR